MDAITHLPTGTLLQGGKYKVVRFLSGNGHEYTYEAEHTLLSNRVVVKEFYVEYFCSRDEATARVTISANRRDEFVESLKKDFIKKAKIVFQMRHQHIARVLDIFEENGTAYYVMEYIDGLSLQEMVDQRGRLSERDAVKYVTQVADALKYVHSLNRLHLGLKPSKIIVNPSGNAVLIGFVAMTKYDDEEENSGLSTKDSGLSTTGYPHYAPIERMGAHSANFTPATDIYSLGATLYTLLTGITPPNAFSLVGEEETLQPLPQNISQGVRDAVYAAMRLRMRERPQTISEFIHILDWGESDGQDEETVINSEETIINNGEAIINNEGTVINGEETITKDAPSSSANDGGFVYTSAWLKEHTKIRGWLAFFLFTVMTSGVCSGVLTIATFDTSDYQGFLCLGFAYLTMGLLLFGTAMCALYAFFKRKPNAVFLVVTYLILVFATSLLSLIIVSSSKNSNVLSNTMSFIQSFVYSIIWLTYVSSSNRVKEVIPPSFRKATRRDWLILLGAILVPIIFMSIGMLQVRSVNNKNNLTSSEFIMSTISTINGHEWVDLGLSVKWATCNVGASSPSDYGNYYAWGETSTKSSYTSDKSATYGKNMGSIAGNSTYDAARANWGDTWRLPTKAEIEELVNKCKREWTTQGGHRGYKVTGPNGNSIFLPAAGWRNASLNDAGEGGYYWSATPDEDGTNDAYYLGFGSSDFRRNWSSRSDGQSVRPVTE